MRYSCVTCNYETDDFGNWSRHKKSKRHVQKNNQSNKLTCTDSCLTPTRLQSDSDSAPYKNRQSLKNIKSNKVENKFECNYCGNNYSKSSNLSRHLKFCISKKHNLLENQFEIYKREKDIEIKEKDTECQLQIMKEKLKILEEKNKTLENHIDTLKSENNFQKQLISSAGGLIQKSMNTMSYLLLNYNKAPELLALNDYSVISKDTETLIKDLVH